MGLSFLRTNNSIIFSIEFVFENGFFCVSCMIYNCSSSSEQRQKNEGNGKEQTRTKEKVCSSATVYSDEKVCSRRTNEKVCSGRPVVSGPKEEDCKEEAKVEEGTSEEEGSWKETEEDAI